MVCERQVTARAFEDVAAIAAENISGTAAPVEKQDGLLVMLQNLRQRRLQGPAEYGPVTCLQFRAHIHDFYRWKVDGFCLVTNRVIMRADPQLLDLALHCLAVRQDTLRQAKGGR